MGWHSQRNGYPLELSPVTETEAANNLQYVFESQPEFVDVEERTEKGQQSRIPSVLARYGNANFSVQ